MRYVLGRQDYFELIPNRSNNLQAVWGLFGCALDTSRIRQDCSQASISLCRYKTLPTISVVADPVFNRQSSVVHKVSFVVGDQCHS
jgi:hypothetical protein